MGFRGNAMLVSKCLPDVIQTSDFPLRMQWKLGSSVILIQSLGPRYPSFKLGFH